jgi:hypothetical protein
MQRHALFAAAAALALAGPARADIIFADGFEGRTLPHGGHPLVAESSPLFIIPGWAVSNEVMLLPAGYVEFGGAVAFSAADGGQSLDLTGAGNRGLTSGVWQNVATVAGVLYELTFALGRADAGPESVYATPSSLRLVIDDGVPLLFTNADVNLGSVNWKEFTTTFVATGPTTTVGFFNATSDNNFVGLDAVRVRPAAPEVIVESINPEPATVVLAGLGLVGLAGYARWKRVKKA